MDGATIGGLLAMGLAGVALAGSFVLDPPPDEWGRGSRLLGRAFIAGIGCLGLVVVLLAWTLESDVSGGIGLALGLLAGLAALGDLVVLRSAQPGPRGRALAVMLLVLLEGIAILAITVLLLALFLTAPY